jgi:uncharacterized protein (TIGR02421 family)
MNAARLDKTRQHDEVLTATAKSIRILVNLRWPPETEDSFLAGWRSGNPGLPDPGLVPLDFRKEIGILEGIQSECDRAHPLDDLVYKTARSYASAARMLGAIGTPDFTRHSIELYGKPDDRYEYQDQTALTAADYFLTTTDDLLGTYVVPPSIDDIPAEVFAGRLQAKIDEFFDADKVEVLIDPELPSKSIAGSKHIRLRAGAMFSELDLDQLFAHEAEIHAATMLNGQRQTSLRLLSLGAPRTTRTQEGLAMLAELMTYSLDITRLRRIAMRIRAIAMALDGADFIEVFRTFLEAGQSETESYQSAVRCFRGGDVRGRIAFTKDTVYLKGMIEAYAFLATCIHENRPELAGALFAGRLTFGDVVQLAPYFETGFLKAPHYLPGWAADLRKLLSVFAINAFYTRFDLTTTTLARFVDHEEAGASGLA